MTKEAAINRLREAEGRWASSLSRSHQFRSVFVSAIRPVISAATAALATAAVAQDSYAPFADRSYPTAVYWGDTHLHTSLSLDAYTYANRMGPEQAYRFARGEMLTASNGVRVRLRRPLDFLVVADHAEAIGVMQGLEASESKIFATDDGKHLSRRFGDVAGKSPSDPKTIEILWELSKEIFDPFDHSSKRPAINEAFSRSVWSQVASTADRYNDPGRFTTFIGYEWTPIRGNLHRVVIFKDGAEKAHQVTPFSAENSSDPEALWAYMADYEKRLGGEVLAIPHNGNLSGGEMFPLQNSVGEALTRSYAERRTRWEPLYEAVQTKGNSEAHPFLSPTDEFAEFEIWSADGFYGTKNLPPGRTWDDAERRRKEGEYARAALKRGLKLQAELGANPFKFGMIGSTDAHTSLAAVDEDNFWGITPMTPPGPERPARDKLSLTLPLSISRELARKDGRPEPTMRAWQITSAGYAALWATENTREALFAAMKRKEAYATTGPRMTVRFFGGWEYAPEDAHKPDLALIGYRKGVPMGGDLTNAPQGTAPCFLIRAVKDPNGANLDRVQVIKGWLKNGEIHEKIYNVALSDGRKEALNGRVPPVGSTVDVPNATYTNIIGDPELAVVWTDSDFDRNEPAFYYVRVIEIPTPRWTAYDAKLFNVRNITPEIPMVIQERAYTSPIWYSPRSR